MRLVLTTAVLLVGAASGALAQGAAMSASPAPSPSPAAVVHIRDYAYVPRIVHVRAGETVRFVNDDEAAHTVTATDKSYDSGDLPNRAAWTHTYAVAGTAAYYCAYHPFMKGVVEVEALPPLQASPSAALHGVRAGL